MDIVMFWPILVAILLLGLAYLIFTFGADMLDFGKWFSVVIIGFLLLFAAAAAYLVYKLPSLSSIGGTKTSSTTKSLTVPDVIVTD